MSSYSNLAIVSALVLYVLAFLAHTAEWAIARKAPAAPRQAGEHAGQGAELIPTAQSELVAAGGGELVGSGAAGGGAADGLPLDPGPADRAIVDSSIEPDTPDTHDMAGAGPWSEMFGRLGVRLTWMGWGFAVIGVVLRGLAAGRPPWGNQYEFTITAMVLVVGTYLVLSAMWKMRWLGLPVTLLASVAYGLAVTVFYVAVAPLVPALHTIWFLIHISAAATAGAAFNVGGAASIIYLLKIRREHLRAAGQTPRLGYLDRLPSARRMDTLAYRLFAFAFPMWTFAVAAGSIWAEYAWGRYWGWDPKETWALVTWIIYACYLHARSTAGWRGTAAAWIAIIGMASFWFNFIGVNLFISGLHSYAGI